MNINMNEFKLRRQQVIKQLPNNSIAIIAGATNQYRNSDVEYPFRQNSDFYYLSGFIEPDAICILSRGANEQQAEFILFSASKDKTKEVWTGIIIGQDDAKTIYGADHSYSNTELDRIMPSLLANKTAIYSLFSDQQLAVKILQWIQVTKSNAKKQPTQISNCPEYYGDLAKILSELRLIKSAAEIALLRQAAQYSSAAHTAIMQQCRSGQYEYNLAAIFTKYCSDHGCPSQAYQIIVASGANACTLHYTANNKQLVPGELVLIDAGCEAQYYAADLTRTFPVSGKFSEPQRLLYELVLNAQIAGLQAIMPGKPFASVQTAVVNTLVAGLVEYGLLKGKPEDLIATQAYKQFYMHNASHWLGLDVHDAGQYYQNGTSRNFMPGMVCTLEPGLYIAIDNENVAKQWRGIGIRIEDMILVTEHSNEVLSAGLAKTSAEITALRN